jgi:predicted dehydrogenase
MYRVGVIGLGAIAEGYGAPDNPTSYCHVGGIQHSEAVSLAAVADLDPARRERFREKWGGVFPTTAYYDSHQAMLAGEALDIVAVCVRGPHHFAVMQDVIAAGPRAIFLEKPPTCSLAEMDEMVAAARLAGIPITVSYSRHFAPHVLRLQELVQEGLIGEVQTVVGYVGQYFLSFASHVTDLICQFAGYCPTAVFARGKLAGEAPEGYEVEPTLDLMSIEFANGVQGLQVGLPGEHGGFYADVFGTEGMVRVGIYIPPWVRDKQGQVRDPADLGLPEDASVFKVAYGQIAAHLAGGLLPHCTNEAFVAVHEIGFAGIESVYCGQRITLPNTRRDRKVFANG